jgi:hypothetical protein
MSATADNELRNFLAALAARKFTELEQRLIIHVLAHSKAAGHPAITHDPSSWLRLRPTDFDSIRDRLVSEGVLLRNGPVLRLASPGFWSAHARPQFFDPGIRPGFQPELIDLHPLDAALAAFSDSTDPIRPTDPIRSASRPPAPVPAEVPRAAPGPPQIPATSPEVPRARSDRSDRFGSDIGSTSGSDRNRSDRIDLLEGKSRGAVLNPDRAFERERLYKIIGWHEAHSGFAVKVWEPGLRIISLGDIQAMIGESRGKSNPAAWLNRAFSGALQLALDGPPKKRVDQSPREAR